MDSRRHALRSSHRMFLSSLSVTAAIRGAAPGRSGWLLLVAVAGLCGMCGVGAVSQGAESPTFERDVYPILKTHCLHCHGEDGKREGGLDLRLARLLKDGGESGPAIVPGAAAESYLLERVRSGEMPPGEKRLSERDVAVIQRWVAAGAPTARPEPEELGEGPLLTAEERAYWAFQPVTKPALPELSAAHAGQARNAVDQFILRRLQKHALTLSPEASRRTLIRRAYFDLLGLPPEPEAIEAFLADDKPDAYERLIDELLASPRYGERWGRHWLDVAGYADSEGYNEEDRERPWAYRYRDYVIRSLNRDKPFDQFVREQLAGDEMLDDPQGPWSAADVERLTATGFLRMAPDGTAGGGDQEVARNEVIADTLEIVSTSLLGMTVGCARCHDHRYDPIPTRDYYRLRAVFEPAYDWKQWKPPAARLVSLATEEDRKLAAKIEAEAVQVDREREAKAQFYIDRTLEEELQMVAAETRDALREAYRAPAAKRSPEQQQLLKDYPSVANISTGSLYLYDRRREARAGKLDAERRRKEKEYVERARQQALARLDDSLRAQVLAAWKTAAAQRTAEQRRLLEEHPQVSVELATLGQFDPAAAAEIQADRERAAKLRAEKAADDLKRYSERAAEIRGRIPPEQFVRALTEPANHQPQTFVFYRGDHQQPKQAVAPGDLSVLSAPGELREVPPDDPRLPTSGRRLAYARQLTRGDHPLLARVLVNRVWLHHFGRGLVASPGDFGVLGERPTHPQLLDYLAAEFVGSGWQLKTLHRLIMNSATYRQASRRTDALQAADPDNRLFGRQSLRRLETEVVRDSILSVSGKLSSKMFGPPVPVMEDEVGQIVLGKENLDGERKPTKPVPLNGEEYRRSLYVQVRRSRVLGVLESFDTATLTPNCTQRSASTVAPQSLMMMNSEFSVEYSRKFAERLIRQAGPSLRDQLALAWRLAFGQEPEESQLDGARALVASQRALLLAQEGTTADVARHRALATFCQALMSANRFLYVD